jgi:HlyD family secretion protein
MAKRRIRLTALVVAAVVIAGAVAGLLLRPAALEVELGAVGRGPLRVTIDEEGQTRVRHRYVMTAPFAGELERIGLEEGDSVEVGSVVARLLPLPLDARGRQEARARVKAAEARTREVNAEVDRAAAALAQARRARARSDSLAARELVSREEREMAELAETSRAEELESARFRARAASFEVEEARAALLAGGADGASPGSTVEIRSPIGGRILRVLEESERTGPAGMPLVEIGDVSDLEIVVDVLSSDAVKIRPGARMLLDEWGGSHPLEATVRRVEPSGFTEVSALGVEEQRVNVIADLAGPAAPLGDRYRVEARIVVWESDDVLKIPASALFRLGAGWAVFIAESGRARLREVEVGHRSEVEAEVLGGVRAGERVLLYPSDRISDGVRVRVRQPR